jgi:hypothetical protein
MQSKIPQSGGNSGTRPDGTEQVFMETLRAFRPCELRWDLNCNVHNRTRDLMRHELQRRGESEYGYMERRGGPFVNGSRWHGHRVPPSASSDAAEKVCPECGGHRQVFFGGVGTILCPKCQGMEAKR